MAVNIAGVNDVGLKVEWEGEGGDKCRRGYMSRGVNVAGGKCRRV